MAGNPQLMPTYDANDRYIYLFSRKGQLGDVGRTEWVPKGSGSNAIGVVDLDQFIHAAHLSVDWDAVYREIVRVAELNNKDA